MKPSWPEHVDTLVLGCTISIDPGASSGNGRNDVSLVDSARPWREITAELLVEKNSINPSQQPPEYRFYVSDVSLSFPDHRRTFFRPDPHETFS